MIVPNLTIFSRGECTMKRIDGVSRQVQQNSANPINHGYVAIPEGIDRDAFIETCLRRNRVTIVTEYGAVINECYVLKNVLQTIDFPEDIGLKGSCVCYVCGDFSNKPIVIGVIDENDQSDLLNENMFYLRKKMNGTDILMQGDPNNGSLIINVTSQDPSDITIAVKGNEENELNIESSGFVNVKADKGVNVKSFETITGAIIDVEKPDDIHNITWDKEKLSFSRKTENADDQATLNDEGFSLTMGENVSVVVTKEKVDIKTGDSTLLMDNSIINFNGGGLKGLVEVEQLTQKLNTLVQQVNAFINVYNTHIHPASMGTTSSTVSQATTVSTFNKSDYENTKITQG